MAEEREVVVLSGVRTAIGKYGGSLKDFSPTDLGGRVIAEAVQRSGLEPDEIGHVVFGNILHTDSGDMYGGRLAMLKAGLPIEVPALTLNRLCGSGLQAIVTASHYIKLGYAAATVAGGMEVMSRAQYWLPGMRWGSPPSAWRPATAFLAPIRMRWPWKATAAPCRPSTTATSRTRSCPSPSRRRPA
jgi:acetyl-CoA C-acetyltransferase